jgi:hypothetical protein
MSRYPVIQKNPSIKKLITVIVTNNLVIHLLEKAKCVISKIIDNDAQKIRKVLIIFGIAK